MPALKAWQPFAPKYLKSIVCHCAVGIGFAVAPILGSYRYLWVVLLLLVTQLSLAEPLQLNNLPTGSLGKWAELMLEDGPELKLDKAMLYQQDQKFSQGIRAVYSDGIGAPPLWVHLKVNNPTAESLSLYLLAGTTWIDQLDVYVIHDNRISSRWHTGDENAGAPGIRPGAGFAFMHKFMPGRSDIYFRVESVDPLVLPIELKTPNQFIASERLLHYRYGLIFGFLVALIIYNLILFVSLKKQSYLYYSFYLSSLVLLMLAYTGHGVTWFWPNQPHLQRYVILGLMVLYGISGLLFASRFLALAEHAPRTLAFVRLNVFLVLVLMVFCIVLDSHRGAALVAFSFIVLFILLMVVLGILTVRDNHVAGRYYLPATLFGMIGAALTLSAVLGWLPFNDWTFYGLDYGALIEATLLSLALSHHFNKISAKLSSITASHKALSVEVDKRIQAEKYEQFRSSILELLAGSAHLNSILEAIVRGVEKLNPTMLCSILLLDEQGKHLNSGAVRSLPEFYNAAVEGIEIGPSVGSCGAAAFTGVRVIVEDISTHPNWAPYKEITARAGLGACWSQPIRSSAGQVLGTFAIYHHQAHSPTDADIYLIEQSAHLASIAIERKQMEDYVSQLAMYDPLTNLPNRRMLLRRLHQAMAASSRSGKQGALLFIDLDHFKTINDTLGHYIGDLMLQQVALRLASCVREGDTVARLGGDEFVVMLEGLSVDSLECAEQTEIVSEKILHVLGQPYQLADQYYHNTPSIGATLYNSQKQSAEELLKQADIAMYHVKKSGRNALCFFDPKMQSAINARASLEEELRIAIQEQQFQLYYQIQVDSSQRPVGAEALIRWIHPKRGLISPIQFIQLAEETGLILPIGKWLIGVACTQLKAWQQDELTRNLVLSINVSAQQFRQADFFSLVQTSVQAQSINPHLLKFELTESMLVNNVEETINTMLKFKEIGIRFSLDDFGTGYSSLQYLKRLPLSQLKIDQSFVRDLESSASDQTIVRTIIAMAQSLNLDVIAEGVETIEQQHRLMNKGCHYFQGYLFGKPVPIEQFEAALRQNSLFSNQII